MITGPLQSRSMMIRSACSCDVFTSPRHPASKWNPQQFEPVLRTASSNSRRASTSFFSNRRASLSWRPSKSVSWILQRSPSLERMTLDRVRLFSLGVSDIGSSTSLFEWTQRSQASCFPHMITEGNASPLRSIRSKFNPEISLLRAQPAQIVLKTPLPLRVTSHQLPQRI